MPNPLYREGTLQSGEIMILTSEGDHPNKPRQVMQITADGEEVRWTKDFATQEEAEKEFVRFGIPKEE